MRKSIKEEVKFLQGKLEENENSILFARLADAYLQMDRVDDAIEVCEKGIKKHPYYVTGHYVLGKCYLKKKLFDQAEKELKRVLLFDPKYIAAHRDYGELMAQIGWHNTCEMSYEEILRIDPFNETARQRLLALKEQPRPIIEEKPEEQVETELEEVEESIIAEIAPKPEEEPQLAPEEISDEISMEAPEKEFDELELEITAEPAAKQLFKETEDIFEEDKANLDLLEDIFRDEDLQDLKIGEDFESPLPKGLKSYAMDEFSSGDQGYVFGEEFLEDQDVSVIKDIDGLSDDEVIALMAGDNEFSQPKIKSPLDIHKPPARRDRAAEPKSPDNETPEQITTDADQQLASSTLETLEYLRKETKPKFEPPVEKVFKEPPKTEKSVETTEETESLPLEDSQRKKEKIVTSTLGEIYAAQHQYAKAIGVYEILRKKDPNNEFYKQKIEYLQKKLEESQAE